MSSPVVHATAIVGPHVELGEDVHVGPFSILTGRVRVGRRSRIESHVVIGSEHGIVVLGEDNVVHPGAMVGGPPQDLKFRGEETRLEVGDRNQIREFVTLNVGTVTGGGITRVGHDNLLMAYVHVAHDCQIGNHIAIANSTNFAGHVTVQDHVRIGGMCMFNQFVIVGKYAFLAGGAAVNKDIMPFTIAQGVYAVSRATNEVGLDRAGIPKSEIDNVSRAIRKVLKGGRTVEEALKVIESDCTPSENINYLVQFIRGSGRGIAR